jgi:hypothetical protein
MRHARRAAVFAAVLFAVSMAAPVWANDTQRLIFDAGNNLGLWATQVELFNPAANDQGMVSYATNAFNAVVEVRNRLRPPFTDLDLQSVLDMISRYPDASAGWNAGQKAVYVKQISDLFQSRLSVLYLSTKGVYASPNCDSAFLRVGFFPGRAQMGAFAGNQNVVSGARSDLLQAVRTGLQFTQSIGCGFNVESVWRSLGIDRAMTLADFQALVNPVRQTAFDAVQLYSAAGPIPPSWTGEIPPPPPPPPPASRTLEGQWRSNATDDVIRFEREGNIFRGTFAAVGRSMRSRVGDLMGEFTLTGNNVYSGRLVMTQPDGSVSWLDGVTLRVSGDTATATAPWWNAPVTYTRVNQ